MNEEEITLASQLKTEEAVQSKGMSRTHSVETGDYFKISSKTDL